MTRITVLLINECAGRRIQENRAESITYGTYNVEWSGLEIERSHFSHRI